MNKLINRDKGFTIIEVVLVLAIAALIFLMVFVALPALQRSQRDTARKSDASLVTSSVTKYTSAYKKSPAVAADDANLRQYIDKLDQYEAGNVRVEVNRATKPGAQDVLVYPNSKCDGPNPVDATNKRKLAVVIQLEDKTFYCIDAS